MTHRQTDSRCVACGSRQQAGCVARPAAEDAEVRMATISTLDDESAVGVPRLVDAPAWHRHHCKPHTTVTHTTASTPSCCHLSVYRRAVNRQPLHVSAYVGLYTFVLALVKSIRIYATRSDDLLTVYLPAVTNA